MSTRVIEFIEQVRSGKSSLQREEAHQLEEDLKVIEKFVKKKKKSEKSYEEEEDTAHLAESEFRSLVEKLMAISRSLETNSSLTKEDQDVNTRINNVAGWEVASIAGLVCSHHVSFLDQESSNNPTSCISPEMLDLYVSVVDFLLSHTEARTRSCAAILVRSLAKSLSTRASLPATQKKIDCDACDGCENYAEAIRVYRLLYDTIFRHVSRHISSRDENTRHVRLAGTETHQEEIVLDDLSGWHNLETSYVAYRALLEGFGGRFMHLIHDSPQAYEIYIEAAGNHLNRYVRQAACELIGVIAQCCISGPFHIRVDLSFANEFDSVYPLSLFSSVLGVGMEDSWCQVRLAATQSVGLLLRWVKHSLSNTQSENYDVDTFTPLWEMLVPRLCLNRHYTTDSVRTAAHHSWRHVPLNFTAEELGASSGGGGAGVLALPAIATAASDFYIVMTKHKNHMVCEAACAAIAEFATRVSPTAVERFLPALCLGLRSCLADTSWPVRDSAAIAVGRFLRYNGAKLSPKYFTRVVVREDIQGASGSEPSQSDTNQMEEVIGDLLGLLFSSLLEDPFRPVRESAVVGLVDICMGPNVELGCDVWRNIESFLESNMLHLCSEDNKNNSFVGTHSEDDSKPKKNVQFIPHKMMAKMVQKPNISTQEESLTPKRKGSGRWIYSDWMENPADPASVAAKKRRKKEKLSERVSGGWGCCLDCGAGNDGFVAKYEVSWSCLMLLKELREVVLDPNKNEAISKKGDLLFNVEHATNNPSSYGTEDDRCAKLGTKESMAQYLQWKHFNKIWTLLSVTDFRDVAKFHAAIYESALGVVECFYPPPSSSHFIDSPYFAAPKEEKVSEEASTALNSKDQAEMLQQWLHENLSRARLLLVRDFLGASDELFLHWNQQIFMTTCDDSFRSHFKKTPEQQSPQKDCAFEDFLKKIQEVLGTSCLKSLLEYDTNVSK